MISKPNLSFKIDELYSPDYAVSLGKMISFEMETRGITQQELIENSGIAGNVIDDLINDKAPLTSEIAFKLENAIGMPKQYWLNLETNYLEASARITDKENQKSNKRV